MGLRLVAVAMRLPVLDMKKAEMLSLQKFIYFNAGLRLFEAQAEC